MNDIRIKIRRYTLSPLLLIHSLNLCALASTDARGICKTWFNLCSPLNCPKSSVTRIDATGFPSQKLAGLDFWFSCCCMAREQGTDEIREPCTAPGVFKGTNIC